MECRKESSSTSASNQQQQQQQQQQPPPPQHLHHHHPQASRASSGHFRRLFSRNLKSNDDELAQLESELRKAYALKALQTQMATREAERLAEEIERRKLAEVTRLAHQVTLEEEEQRHRIQEQERHEHYRRELQEQIQKREREREALLEEERREREILVEVDRIREEGEHFRASSRKSELAEKLGKERLIFAEMREIRKQEEREREERKAREDLEYSREIEERTLELRRTRSEFAKKRQSVIERIASTLLDRDSKRLEREALLAEIVGEEIKRELLMKEEEEKLKRKRMARELAAGLEEQIVFGEQCKIMLVEQDKSFAEEIMRRVMEDEKIAKLSGEARRRAKLRYREDLNKLLEERRKIREEEIIRIEEAVKREEETEILRLERIREGRKQLLREHVSNIADFLRRSALTEEERLILEEALDSPAAVAAARVGSHEEKS